MGFLTTFAQTKFGVTWNIMVPEQHKFYASYIGFRSDSNHHGTQLIFSCSFIPWNPMKVVDIS